MRALRAYLDPPHGPAEALFRRLLAPVPSQSLAFRFAAAPFVELRVVALLAWDENEALDAAIEAPAELRDSILVREVLARCLWTDGAPAFAGVEELGTLNEIELDALAAEALPAFAAISPSYVRSSVAAWQRALEKGAAHPSNRSDAMALAACVDHGPRHILYRPDRYWGVPVRSLLDGHWMAFRAARALYDKLNP